MNGTGVFFNKKKPRERVRESKSVSHTMIYIFVCVYPPSLSLSITLYFFNYLKKKYINIRYSLSPKTATITKWRDAVFVLQHMYIWVWVAHNDRFGKIINWTFNENNFLRCLHQITNCHAITYLFFIFFCSLSVNWIYHSLKPEEYESNN